jgi:hypothetical protein
MYSVKSKSYPDSTFFKKNDKVILELEKSGTLWVLYSVWTSISDMFSLDYCETQQLIKAWVEQQLKSGEVSPEGLGDGGFRQVEEQLKSVGVEPLDAGSNYLPFMEKQLKSEEVIPHTSITNQLMRVQEELKSVEIKPVKDENLICQLAELRLNREEVIPKQSMFLEINSIQEEIKSGEITPLQGCVSPFSMDGEELTPQRMDYVIIGGIEEELEPVEITPDIKGHSGSYWAESQLKLVEVRPKQAVFPIEYPEEITPEESIPLQSWRDLEKKEITPRSAIAPPFRWRKLDSVKYAEIKPTISTSYRLEEKIKSEEITPRQVVPGSFDWVQEQIIPVEVTPTSFFVI